MIFKSFRTSKKWVKCKHWIFIVIQRLYLRILCLLIHILWQKQVWNLFWSNSATGKSRQKISLASKKAKTIMKKLRKLCDNQNNLKAILTRLVHFEQVWTNLVKFETSLDKLGSFSTSLKQFGKLWNQFGQL